MGYARYRAVKAEERKPTPAPAVKKGDTRTPRGNRSQQAARRQLTICESAIGKLEKELEHWDEEMALHACEAEKLNELYQQKQATEAQLEEQMLRWEELSLLLENEKTEE